jgi:hypothetical protein
MRRFQIGRGTCDFEVETRAISDGVPRSRRSASKEQRKTPSSPVRITRAKDHHPGTW